MSDTHISISAPQDEVLSETTVFSVEQLNINIKQLIEGHIGIVWVRGEISNFKAHSSGHFYFSLKDQKSQITAVMFRGHNSRLKFKPSDGTEVIARGRVSVYEPRGNYQIICDMMEPVGAGALQRAYEQLREKLKSEGLFDPSRKRPIPHFPKHIAIVTSPTGAAIRDILNILSRRAKAVQVTVVPTIVQGEAAALQICEAMEMAYQLSDVDVIIVGRGGGSMEDMWCFNDENLARVIARSPVPVISAVGHEIDFTIADFVADLRAPTPSAAAELVAKSSAEIVQKIISYDRMLLLSIEKKIKMLLERCGGLSKRLVDPQRKLQDLRLRNDEMLNRLEFSVGKVFESFRYKVHLLTHKIQSPDVIIAEKRKEVVQLSNRLVLAQKILLEKLRTKLEAKMELVDSLSPLRVVDRGYSIIKKGAQIIKSSKEIKVGDTVAIRLAHGEFTATVQSVKE